MGEICVHDYHKIPGTKLQAVDVGGPAVALRQHENVEF